MKDRKTTLFLQWNLIISHFPVLWGVQWDDEDSLFFLVVKEKLNWEKIELVCMSRDDDGNSKSKWLHSPLFFSFRTRNNFSVHWLMTFIELSLLCVDLGWTLKGDASGEKSNEDYQKSLMFESEEFHLTFNIKILQNDFLSVYLSSRISNEKISQEDWATHSRDHQ